LPIQTLGRLSNGFDQNGGLLEMQSTGGGSLIVDQCTEQLGCEIQEDGSFTTFPDGSVLSATNPPRTLNMRVVYGGRLTRSVRRTLNHWQKHTSLLQDKLSGRIRNSRKREKLLRIERLAGLD
jgi:hypothetical protein